MLFDNYDFDTYMAVIREGGREEGYEEGREEGLEIGTVRGREEGREEGIEIGSERGRAEIVNLLKSGKSIDEIIKMYES